MSRNAHLPPIAGDVRFPAPCHIVTCMPCGYREPIRPGHAYPPRCPNCGSGVEHYETEINDRQEWRDVHREGTRMKAGRPRIVIGTSA